jgi:hypothetical protein
MEPISEDTLLKYYSLAKSGNQKFKEQSEAKYKEILTKYPIKLKD